MPRKPRAGKLDGTWQAFAARHCGHPFLTLDPLYALVEDVIDAIKSEIPDFFTPEQEQFERNLARTRGNGFFLRRVIGGELPAPLTLKELSHRPVQTIGEFIDELERIPHSAEEAAKVLAGRLTPVLSSNWLPDRKRDTMLSTFEDFMATLRGESGFKVSAVTKAMADEHKEEAQLRQRQEAYAGWLIMETRFRKELATLRQAHQQEVARLGALPSRPFKASRRRPTACVAECLAFYQRWGLERLLTWDLPLPLPAHFELLPDGQVPTSNEAALLAIPWYLLRGGMDLRQTARRLRYTSAPTHLRDWILKESGSDHDVAGEYAYQRLFWLYRCYELALRPRYPDACARNLERLDRAMAAVMGRGEDLVKKLRQRLGRALSGKKSAVDNKKKKVARARSPRAHR